MRLKIRSRLSILYSLVAIVVFLSLVQYFPVFYIGIILGLAFLLMFTTRWDRNFFSWILRYNINRKPLGSYAFDNTITTANSVIDRNVIVGDNSNAIAVTGIVDPGVIIWRDHIASTFIKISPKPLTAGIVGSGNQFAVETIDLNKLASYLEQFELRLADIFVHIHGGRGRTTSDNDYGASYTARLGADVPGLYTASALIELRFDTRDMLFQCGRRVWPGESIVHGINRSIRLCRDRLMFGLQHHGFVVDTISDKDIDAYHTNVVSTIKKSSQFDVDRKEEKKAHKELARKNRCAKKNKPYKPKENIILPSDTDYEQPKKMVFSFFRIYEVHDYGLEDWRRWLKLQASSWFITMCIYKDKRASVRTKILVGFTARQEVHNLAKDAGLKLVAKTPREFADILTIFTSLNNSMIGFFLPLGSRAQKLLNLRSVPLTWINKTSASFPAAVTAPPITGVGVYLGDTIEYRNKSVVDVSRRGEKLFFNPIPAIKGSTLAVNADAKFVQILLLRFFHCQISHKISVVISSSSPDKSKWDRFVSAYPWAEPKRGNSILVCDVKTQPRNGELVIWLCGEDQDWDYYLEWNESVSSDGVARGVGLYRREYQEYLFAMNILDIDYQFLSV